MRACVCVFVGYSKIDMLSLRNLGHEGLVVGFPIWERAQNLQVLSFPPPVQSL